MFKKTGVEKFMVENFKVKRSGVKVFKNPGLRCPSTVSFTFGYPIWKGFSVSLNWPKRRHEIRIWAMLLDRRTSWASCLHRFIDIQNSHLGTLGTRRTIKR